MQYVMFVLGIIIAGLIVIVPKKMKILDKCSLAQISENGKAFIHKYEGRTKVDSKLTLWDIDGFDIDTGGDENVEDINMAEMEENFYKGYKG